MDAADSRYVVVEGHFFAVRGDHFQTMYGTMPRVESVSELRRWYDGREELWEQGADGELQRKQK